MCQLFIHADPTLWQSSTRSLRIDGVVTSIRLESYFWQILDEIALRDGMNVTQLITKLYLESLDADHDISNFTSFLRVCCARFLSLLADGHLQREPLQALEEVDAKQLMHSEAQDMQRRALWQLPSKPEQH
ncbi:ribbon-helix-helix domain-containing protein [Pseudoalteromonas fenneropenaei]|uniref:Ribbon-helix-helix domain-containing protein n=1 Tax=Pseudoalteromonas fenneropenaei TaxID=1737459 RepID=A0ABV7CJ95_9GAMM